MDINELINDFIAKIQAPLLARITELETKVQNTMDNVKPILENMNQRIEHIENDSDERIANIVNSELNDLLEDKIYDYLRNEVTFSVSVD